MARSVMLVIVAGALLLSPQVRGEDDKPTEPVSQPPVAESAAGEAAAADQPAAEDGGQSPAEHAQAIFEHLDANDDGEIASGEVPDDHQRLFRRLLRTADADKNERLNREELTAGLGSSAANDSDGPADPGDDAKQRRRRRPVSGDRQPQRPEGGTRPEEGPRPDGAPFDRLRELDTNQDGSVALDEVPEPGREMFGRLLERFDANDDDSLSGEELDAARAAMSRRFSRGPEGRPEGRGPEARRPGGDGPPGGPGFPGRPGPPGGLLRLLDADRDGSLSAAEIDGAPSTLRKLDRDSDGTLSREELRELGPPGPHPAGSPSDETSQFNGYAPRGFSREEMIDDGDNLNPFVPVSFAMYDDNDDDDDADDDKAKAKGNRKKKTKRDGDDGDGDEDGDEDGKKKHRRPHGPRPGAHSPGGRHHVGPHSGGPHSGGHHWGGEGPHPWGPPHGPPHHAGPPHHRGNHFGPGHYGSHHGGHHFGSGEGPGPWRGRPGGPGHYGFAHYRPSGEVHYHIHYHFDGNHEGHHHPDHHAEHGQRHGHHDHPKHSGEHGHTHYAHHQGHAHHHARHRHHGPGHEHAGRPDGPPTAGAAPDGQQRPDPKAIIERILSSDKNADGKLSKEEAPERLQRVFDEFDANKDGFIDGDELKARIGRGPAGPPRDQSRGDDRRRDRRRPDRERDGERRGPEGGPAAVPPPPPPGAPGTPPPPPPPGGLAAGGPDGSGPENRGRGGRRGPDLNAIVQRILSTDKNGDGKLSKEEASERLKGAFDEIDTNKDGFLDGDELRTRITARMRRGPQAGPDGPRGPGRRGPGDRGAGDRRRGRGPEGRPEGPPEGDAPAGASRPDGGSVDGGSVDGRGATVTMNQTAAQMWQVFVAPWL